MRQWARPIVSAKPAPIDTREVAPAVEANSEIQPIDAHEVVPAVEANSDIPQLEHIGPVTDPHVSTIPGDEASIPSSKASKKTSLFSGKGIVICAMLSLATGIAVGAAWSRTDVTSPDVQNQLNAIARDLSSQQQNIKELAAGQEQIRKTQGQLAEAQSQAQSHLAVLQAQANAKQNKQSAPATTEDRKFYRRDYRYR